MSPADLVEKRRPLTRREIIEVVTYNPETGEFIWLPRARKMFSTDLSWRVWNHRWASKPAFVQLNLQGYRVGRLYRQRFVAHRVAWLLIHGEWPDQDIDHIDGDRSNNRMANLRAVDRALNARNAKQRSDNASGVTGVHWHRASRKWRAHIHFAGRYIHLGMYADLGEAAAARKAADVQYGFSPRHGAAQ